MKTCTKMILFRFLFFCASVVSQHAAVVTTPESTLFAVTYLRRFGYFNDDAMPSALTSSGHNASTLQAAIMLFQKAFSLPVTGFLDNATVRMLKTPRCALPDGGMIRDTSRKRKRRYALNDSRWTRTELSYFIEQWSTHLPVQTVEQEIKRAFDTWSAVSPLRFYRVNSSEADIVIKFGVRSHGDPYPFDGPGGVLAHAFYPSSGGNSHFDDDEHWSSRTYQGVNLYQVAVHELGHSLGIRHSNVPQSMMFPGYFGFRYDAQLHQDDKDAIHALYGTYTHTVAVEAHRPSTQGASSTQSTTAVTTRASRSRPTHTTKPTKTTPIPTQSLTPPASRPTSPTTRLSSSTRLTTESTQPPPASTSRPISACDVRSWDAVATTLSGNTYFFKDLNYYKQGNPAARLIFADWTGIQGRVDATLTLSSGFTLLIQGEYFWVFRDQKPYDDTKRKIGKYFGKLAREVGAAWTWARDRTFYLVKDGQVWRNNNNYTLDATYPRSFSDEFSGAPQILDAATCDANGTTHFFSGTQYYTLDDSNRSVNSAGKSISQDWFGCNS